MRGSKATLAFKNCRPTLTNPELMATASTHRFVYSAVESACLAQTQGVSREARVELF